ncbi:MAG: ATP-binding cassette domain-containing protein [Finegoldia magna]|nr:ATP-binding cassette domain-containing protein [Finegoldia magna]
MHPSQGQIRYQGRELTSCQLYQAGAYILQSSHVFDDLSVEENIALGQEIDQQRMDNILQETGLLSLKGKVPSNQTLSGGEKQRLEIARALYHKRQFILADEVKANLDAKNQEKIKRDESIRFTSANEFTIHKIEEEDDDEDEFMDTFEVKTKQVFDKINLFFTKILKKMMGGAQPYKFSMRIAVLVLSALPLLFFYMNSTNHWTFTQKSKAIVVMVSVLVLDVFQKVLSYSLGLKLAGTKLYQPIDKDLRYNISVLLSVIESLIFSLFGVLTAGGLVGFSSSVFTFTFLGAHAFIYLISLVILILFATIILVDRFDYKNLWKIYGLNAAGIVITRLVVFMVVMTLLQKIFFGLAPGLM